MTPIKTTVPDAMNTVKTWISNKEYDKAIRGIDEILEFEPTNVEAKKLKEETAGKITEPETVNKFAADAVKVGTAPAVPIKEIIAAAPREEATTPLRQAAAAAVQPTPQSKASGFLERTHRKISPIGIAVIAAVLLISGVAGFFGSKYLKSGETETEIQAEGSVVAPATEEPATEQPSAAPVEESAAPASESAMPSGSDLKGSLIQAEEPEEAVPTEAAPTATLESTPEAASAATSEPAPETTPTPAPETAPTSEPTIPMPQTEEITPAEIETAPAAPQEETTAQAESTTQPNRTPLQFLMDAFGITGSPAATNIEPTEENAAAQTTAQTPASTSETPQRIKVKRR